MAPKRKVSKKTSSKSFKSAAKSGSKTRAGAPSKKRSLSRTASANRSETRVTNMLNNWSMHAPRQRSSSRTTVQRSRSVSRRKSTERRRSASRVSSVTSIRAAKSKSRPRVVKKRKVLSTLDQNMRKVKPRSVLKEAMLPIEVLDKFSLMAGLKSPSVLYHVTHAKSSDEDPEYIHPSYFQVVPSHERFTQIHYIPDHYLVSHQNNGTVFIFDSVNCSKHVEDVLPQLTTLYRKLQTSGVPREYIRYLVPQTQDSAVDCGLFAAANALMLHQKARSPFEVTLDEHEMRPHLAIMLEKNKVKQFPITGNATRSDSRADISAGGGDARQRKRLYSCDADEFLAAMNPKPVVASGAIPSVTGFQLLNDIFIGEFSVMGVAQLIVIVISIIFLAIYVKETFLPILGYPSQLDDIG